jgi:soluble lytic murein transglycosylase
LSKIPIRPQTPIEWLTKILNETHEASALYDPEINIRYGTFFLNYLYDYYGNYQTAFAAYNAGMGNVSKWLASEKYSDGGKLISIPFSETANYVRVVTARAEKYQKIYKLKG